MTLPLLPLPDVITQYQLATKKSLGQHFLLDTDLLARIARAAGDLSHTHVIEIGPGPGGLTRALLETNAPHVTAIEKDARCIAALTPLNTHYQGRFTLLEADAMQVDLLGLVPPPIGGRLGGGHPVAQPEPPNGPSPTLPLRGRELPRAVVANLPYNVGTALVVQWLELAATHGREALTSFTVMLQKEVSQRLCAQPGDAEYGRLSVLAHLFCDAEELFDVPPECFSPPPKVMSSILRATILEKPRFDVHLKTLEQVTASAFNNRRKMLRQSLKSVRNDAEAWCVEANIDPTLRAENCSLEMFVRLANGLR